MLAGLAARSPFEMRITRVIWHCRCGPILLQPEKATIDLAGAFKRRLWRLACARRLSGGVSCAALAEEGDQQPRCAQPEACAAETLMPLDPARPAFLDQRGQVAVLRNSAQPDPTHVEVVLTLRGEAGLRYRDVAATALEGALADLSAGASQTTLTPMAAPTIYTEQLVELVKRLAGLGVNTLRLRTLTPWILGRAGRSTPRTDRIEPFIGSIGRHVAARAYKFATLDLNDPGAGYDETASSEHKHALALRARDRARADLSTVAVSRARLRACIIQRKSASNRRRYTLVGIKGHIDFQKLNPSQLAWLAMLSVLGAGEHTADGYGVILLEPLASSRR